MEPLFIKDLVTLSSSKINSNSLSLLLLVELLTLTKLAVLVKKLLFIDSSAKLTLALLILKVGLIPIKGLVELVALAVTKPIFIDGPALLALLSYLAKSPSIKFSSLKLS